MFGSKVRPPTITPLPKKTDVTATGEAEAARRDMEERMKRAAMNRSKSQLTMPALATPVATMRPVLSEKLG